MEVNSLRFVSIHFDWIRNCKQCEHVETALNSSAIAGVKIAGRLNTFIHAHQHEKNIFSPSAHRDSSTRRRIWSTWYMPAGFSSFYFFSILLFLL